MLLTCELTNPIGYHQPVVFLSKLLLTQTYTTIYLAIWLGGIKCVQGKRCSIGYAGKINKNIL